MKVLGFLDRRERDRLGVPNSHIDIFGTANVLVLRLLFAQKWLLSGSVGVEACLSAERTQVMACSENLTASQHPGALLNRTSDCASARHNTGDPLKERTELLKIAFSLAFTVVACAVNAQTYQLGQDASKPSQNQKEQDQSLGWGSNIQNARIGRAAELALQHGDRVLALDYAQRAVRATPNNPQLWFLLGYAARLNGKFELSIDAYTHGLRLNPASVGGLSGLAQDYSVTGRTADAERLLKQAITADPKRRNDVLLLGDIYMRSKNYAEAIDWLSKAERMQADTRSEVLLAMSYQQLKQLDQADRYLELAKRHSPNNPEVERTLAGYFRQTGKYSEAIDALRSIRNPRPDVVAELAYTYQLNGKLAESAKLYAQAANAMPKDVSVQLAAAQAEVSAGFIERANIFLKRVRELDPNSYRLHAIRGEIARLQENEQLAADEYTEALAHLPGDPAEGPLYGIQLHMDLMGLYRSLRDDNAARRQLEIAQNQIEAADDGSSNRGSFLRLRAIIRMNAGELDGALSDIKEALAINERDRDDLQINGDILMKLGRAGEAIAAYKKILDIDSANRFALTSLGYASRAVGRDQDAERYFKRLAQADPASYVPYLALGDLYTARREFKLAQASYAKAYSIAPKRALIMAGGMNAAIEAHELDLAEEWLSRVTPNMEEEPQILREKERYLSFKGDYQQSAAVGERAIKVLPRDRDVVVYLGYDLLHLERYDQLLTLMAQYRDVLPREPDIPLLAGYVHKHQGKYEEARRDFTEALERDPEVVTAYVNRGYVLNDLHQPQAAAADFDAAIKRDAKNGEAHLGLAYSELDLHKPQAALRQADLAEGTLGDKRDVHVIRATAYGRENMLGRAAKEYRAALKFTPGDATLHLGLGSTLFGERRYHEAIDELRIAENFSPQNAQIDALLARTYANLKDRDETMRYVQLAENHAQLAPPSEGLVDEPLQSAVYVATGEALGVLGDEKAAMERFRKALDTPHSNRVSVRLAIAQLMEQRDHQDDAERQIALALMEGQAGETAPPTGNQLVAAADVFRGLHDFQLSQSYLEHAKLAGAPDTQVRIGMANNYLALGDSTRAQAELSAVNAVADGDPDYQFLLAEANVYRQQHHGGLALTSFAQASNAGGDDQAAEQSLLEAGAEEGLRITPALSMLADFSVEPIFEDTTVYVLDSKLDALFPVPVSDTAHLPPPRSSLETQTTEAYHLHAGNLPVASGFFQVRNAQGMISVPSTNSVVNRNTTDYNFNFGLNPTIHLGSNVLTFNSGIQATIRRDTRSPIAMNQNLFRMFTYMTSSSFFNAFSVSGYVVHDAGPFTDSNLHSKSLTGGIDFRVGSPWGKTSLLTGWGSTDQNFSPVRFENYYTSSYIGMEHRFSEKFAAKAIVEDVRAWRVVGPHSGIAQNLRPAGTIDFRPGRNWNMQFSSAYSSTRSFHVYDATQNGFSISYAKPVHRKFRDDSGAVVLEYPIRFSAGLQEEQFFNFPGKQSQQFRPYIGISFF